VAVESEVQLQSGSVSISAIKIGERKRDLGDVSSLAQSINDLGLLNPITILQDGTLIAGYHRLHACKQLGWDEIEANVVDLDTLHAELAEIDENLIRNELHWFDRDKQLTRRKEIYEALHPETKSGIAQAIGMNRALNNDVSDIVSPTFVTDTASKMGVTERTIERSIQRANTFTEEQGEILKSAAIPQTEATQIARLDEPDRASVIEALARREIKREQVKERLAQLKTKGVELPTGKYGCLVVDPPWQMQKIERDVRPNQVEFDYPTMTEEELKAFPLPDVAGDDCHLYLWTTQKHLPLALRLAEHWGFRYQCLLTWRKNVGFTPFSWMYSTEHVLFCTKGSLPLLKLGKRLDFEGVGFEAKVREHSRKPDEFYDIVREVSPGPRLDIFSREKRDGFDQYGNEVGKFDVRV